MRPDVPSEPYYFLHGDPLPECPRISFFNAYIIASSYDNFALITFSSRCTSSRGAAFTQEEGPKMACSLNPSDREKHVPIYDLFFFPGRKTGERVGVLSLCFRFIRCVWRISCSILVSSEHDHHTQCSVLGDAGDPRASTR